MKPCRDAGVVGSNCWPVNDVDKVVVINGGGGCGVDDVLIELVTGSG